MNIANKISTFRILTVPFFIACLLYYSPEKEHLRFIAIIVFILAVFSDFIDGYVARKKREYSPAGMVLDPLGDKILLISAFITLHIINTGIRIPLWVSFIVVSRDAIILLGIIAIFFVKQKLDMRPSLLGKMTTTFQMFSVLAVLFRFRFSDVLWSIAVFFTIISGINYIRKGFGVLYASAGNNK